MLQANNIKTILFTILCMCFIFYLFLGIYSYKKDRKSKVNLIFLALCISTSFKAIGYAFMLISPNIEIANIWRIFSAFGGCLFSVIWVSFALSLKGRNQKKSSMKIQYLLYIIALIFFVNILLYDPSKAIVIKAYGFVDNIEINTAIRQSYNIYIITLLIACNVIIYFIMKNSRKNRVRKQIKIIFITSLVSAGLGIVLEAMLPALGIMDFPAGIITVSIAMGGIWYAINKYKMMSISYELISEYIFEAVNEPIIILGEDFLVKNCNEASLNITGYNNKDLEQNTLDTIINFRNFNFNTIMQTGKTTNIEIDLYKKNKEVLVCELAATVIYDEYKDILGILILLHDVSEKNKINELQKKYSLELEEANIQLKNEITERLLAENQIRHYVYYDALTELSNRKKMVEDINLLLKDTKEKFAILFIDLDKFKNVNDNYGHQAGDYILKTVAIRLKGIIRSTDTIYRIGGDELIIILRDLNVAANPQAIAAVAIEKLSTAFNYNETQLFIGASIGISIFPEHGIDADLLINRADFAMYEVKRTGGMGYKLYSLEMKEEYELV